MEIKDLSFEQALQELEGILLSLEKGQLTLEEALQGFERGIQLTRHCQSRLKAAEQRVEILMQNEEDKPIENPESL